MLEWALKYGRHQEFYDNLAAEGEIVPALEKQPVLFDDLRLHWTDFWNLDATRKHDMAGPQPIEYSEILSYCELHGIIDPTQRQRMERRIRFLDEQYLTFQAKKAKSKTKGRTHGPN